MEAFLSRWERCIWAFAVVSILLLIFSRIKFAVLA